MFLGGNLAEVEPILVIILDNEAFEVPTMPQVPEVFGEKVEHSFVGGKEVESISKVEIPPKFMKVWEKPNQEKRRAPIPVVAAEAPRSCPAL